jgi:hypothetical protein
MELLKKLESVGWTVETMRREIWKLVEPDTLETIETIKLVRDEEGAEVGILDAELRANLRQFFGLKRAQKKSKPVVLRRAA